MKFFLTSSLVATLLPQATARLAAVNTAFESQVQELVKTAPPVTCQRGPGSKQFCAEDEFCKLDNSSTCPSTEHRRFTGTCVPAGNIACAAIWDPVCGCDGETYGSECNANAARVDIKHKGECKKEARATPCPAIYAPVCGCDGNTYDNDCIAEAAGTEVCSEGECLLGASYCTFAPDFTCYVDGWPACCSDDFGGASCPSEQPACDVNVVACPLIYAPVCGCDMNTYDNSCLAEAAGTTVCNADAACQPCPKNIAPVCGENGFTYDNECIATNFGQEVVSEGQCPLGASYCTFAPDDKCYVNGWPACCSDDFGGASCPAEQPACDVKRCERGVTASKFCDEGEFCKLDNSSSCPSTENRTFKGTCVPAGDMIPCPLNWAPVCGCDGVTYGNECAADAASVDIKHKGECKAEDNEVTME